MQIALQWVHGFRAQDQFKLQQCERSKHCFTRFEAAFYRQGTIIGADLHFEKKKKCRQGMNCQTFPQNPCRKEMATIIKG